ncbi:hypothetical protein [Chamaesiphon minutus]|uniref:Uncharacterized protein n=1 Tax=Chamaesiphon minutus (strain ATCC 27169 / PCC 6605) TaxID=1173020 RepID=K9UMI6_CHAP6|nr:hypothetical protein [Chamaesiphon minutus]AFY95404.1 hypothetical protein Cha6605_4475 [Chamaesiphon minutus PCC 6605]
MLCPNAGVIRSVNLTGCVSYVDFIAIGAAVAELVVCGVNKVNILRGASDLRTPLFPDGLAHQDSGEGNG